MLETLPQGEPGTGIVLEHPGDEVELDALLLPLEGGGTTPPVLLQGAAVLGRVLGRG